MDVAEAIVGTRVQTMRAWSGVPIDTQGVIVEHYGSGVMVAWDLPDRPLPDVAPEEMTFEAMPAVRPESPLRDGFALDELHHLAKVE
jgi:hypothetical protein